MTSTERPVIAVVTGSEHKVRAVRECLPQHHVIWAHPREYVIEANISENIPHDSKRSLLVALEKALHDYSNPNEFGNPEEWINEWRRAHQVNENVGGPPKLVVFNDVTQFIPELGFVCERPATYKEWLYQALLQSGREVCIRAAYTALQLDFWNPTPKMETIETETVFHALHFTKSTVRSFADHVGIEHMMNSPGGLPVQLAASFFDESKPVAMYYYPDAHSDDGRVKIEEVPWLKVDNTRLNRYATGAHPGSLMHLMKRVDTLQ